MTTIKRESKTFDIDKSTFKHFYLKNYVKTYFVGNSLNISSEVPILVLENIPITSFSGGHIEICISRKHPFYNLFKELCKDNINLYNTYFKNSANIEDKIKFNVYYEQKHKSKFLHEKRKWCKLDMQVKISHYEGLLYEENYDSEYIDYWFFRLDLNKIEFV